MDDQTLYLTTLKNVFSNIYHYDAETMMDLVRGGLIQPYMDDALVDVLRMIQSVREQWESESKLNDKIVYDLGLLCIFFISLYETLHKGELDTELTQKQDAVARRLLSNSFKDDTGYELL